MLDDAHNKSQPKLVYARGGISDSPRDTSSKTSLSAPRNVQPVSTKVDTEREECQKENFHQKVISTRTPQNKQADEFRFYQEREGQQTKDVVVRRELAQAELQRQPQQILLQEQPWQPKQIQLQEQPRQPKQILQLEQQRQPKQVVHQEQQPRQPEQTVQQEQTKQVLQYDLLRKTNQVLQQDLSRQPKYTLDQEQQRKPTQIDVGYMSTSKGPKGNEKNVVNNYNLQPLSLKQDVVSDKQSNKPKDDTFNKDQTAGRRSQDKEKISSEKSSLFENTANPMLTTIVTSGQSVSKISDSSLANIHLITDANIDSDYIDCLGNSISRETEKYPPKQIYWQIPVPSNKQQKNQQLAIFKQEQSNLNQQLVPENRLHVTAIKVHKFIPEGKKILPMKDETSKAIQVPETSSVPMSSYCQPDISILSTSPNYSEEITSLQRNQEWDEPPLSPSSPSPSSSPPKSILKNSPSIDNTNLSASTKPIIIPDAQKQISPDYVFSSKLASKINPFSKNEATNLVKGLKLASPPSQTKRHATAETAITNNDLKKDGLAPKKSVRFNSEVQLHLDSEVSTVEYLPVEA